MNLPSLFRNNNEVFSADPFRRLTQLQNQIDELFQEFPSASTMPKAWSSQAFLPTCDVKEVEDHYVLSMDIPGMNKDDIKIEMNGNQLSISGERKQETEEKKKGMHRSERFYGSFERTFSLPDGVKAEHIATEYKNGVLSIAIPKAAVAKTQQIKIGESKPGFFEKLFKRDSSPSSVKDAGRVA